MLRRQFGSLLAKASTNSAVNPFLGGFNSLPTNAQNPPMRTFAHAKVGTITTQLNKLDEATVRKIENDLREVDTDSDGR